MKLKGLSSWGKDFLLKKVIRNSTYLFASQAISAILSILTANLLGVASFGVLGVVISFISNVNRLMSFRMSEFIVRYMGAAIAKDEKQQAVAVIKVAAITEAITSLVAFAILMLLAPWAAEKFAKDPSFAILFRIYGLTILGNIFTETSTGVLQVTGHFRSQAVNNLIQGVITAGLFAMVYINQGGVREVMLVYLVGKLILGLGPVVLAFYWLHKLWGKGWWKGTLKGVLPPRKEMARFAVSTNLSGTINLVARDSEVLWVSYFFSTVEAGYFKVALAVVNLAVMPITPFISTTYPELAKSVAIGAWDRLKSLLKRVTTISVVWTGTVIAGLLILGRQLLFSPINLFGKTIQIYQSSYLPAYTVLMVLMIGFGMANIFFWGRSLLLSFNKPGFVLRVAAIGMLLKTTLAFVLVPKFGYVMEAVLLSAYFIGTVGTILVRGLKEIKYQEGIHTETLPISPGS
jgi:O-antigen/teichoic acid export membrane protein